MFPILNPPPTSIPIPSLWVIPVHQLSYQFIIAEKVQFSSVAQLCPTLCDPMNRSTPGLPVHHQLPEFTQTHDHRVGDAIKPPHPLLSPSPQPSIPPSIKVFSTESTLCMRWPKYWSFSFSVIPSKERNIKTHLIHSSYFADRENEV